MADTVDIRCPVGPRRLFTKVRLGEEVERYIQPENWIEFTCSDCARRLSRQQAKRLRVFHRYTFIGELVQTVVTEHEYAQPAPGEG